MSGYDYLTVENVTVSGLRTGDFEVRGISGIEASYKLSGNVLSVVDDGDLDGETNDYIMMEAAQHYAVKQGTFVGSLRYANLNISIVNNIVVEVRNG